MENLDGFVLRLYCRVSNFIVCWAAVLENIFYLYDNRSRSFDFGDPMFYDLQLPDKRNENYKEYVCFIQWYYKERILFREIL